MTAVGFVGILLSFFAFSWFTTRKDNSRLALFLIITIAHIFSAYVYYLFVQANDADTKLYYFDTFGFYQQGFGLSTMFVIWLTQTLLGIFGGSYLDYFFLYQLLGVWGLALLFRTLDEMALSLGTGLPPVMIVLLFLPGMYFWTSAIGKDAPLFFACALAVWSSFRISSRWIWFALAVGVMVLFRMHIALLTMASLAIAVMAGRGVPTVARIFLVAAAGGAAIYLFATLQAELQVDLSSVGSIANYVEQATGAATQGVDDTLAASSFIVKLFSLLYRPLFFDVENVFGLAASLQNLVMIGITIYLVAKFRLLIELFRGSLAVRFATIHFVTIYLMLAIMYYNVGLGLRQREMATPALLVAVGAVVMVSQLRRRMIASPTPTIMATA